MSKFSYLSRTVPDIDQLLLPLIKSNLIPALTGRPPPNNIDRDLLALPARLGGLGIVNPTTLSTSEYPASVSITAPLSDLILNQCQEYPLDCIEKQLHAKKEVHKQKRDQANTSISTMRQILSPSLRQAVDLAQEKGASS